MKIVTVAGSAAALDLPWPGSRRRAAGASLATVLSLIALPAYAQDAASAPPPPPATPATVPAAPQTADSSSLEEVTVTARHRSEDIEDVPIGITAITSRQLDANPDQLDLKEIQTQIPSLQVEGYSGRNETITIRGLGTNSGSTNDGLEQGVGLYVDDIYYARTGTAILDMSNVDSITVLRGPQGTLFGKNTVAGAIDIQTRQASFTPGGTVEASFGNYGFANVQANVTGPITDELAAQLNVDRTYRDGLIYNTNYHSQWDNRDEINLRADFVYKPSDEFKYRLVVDYDKQMGDDGFLTITQVLPTTLDNGETVAGFYQKAARVGYTPIPIEPFSRETDINSSSEYRLASNGFSGRGDWQIDDQTLTFITGYRKSEVLPNFDDDYSGADIIPEGIVKTHQQQFSQEFRLSSPSGGVVEYTGGLYYFWQKDDDLQQIQYGTDASKWFLGSTADPALLNNFTNSAHVQPITNSYAGYGQATWHITPDLSLTGGFRYTYEDKSGLYDSYDEGKYVPISALPVSEQKLAGAIRPAFGAVTSYSVHTDDGEPSGTVDLSYKITPDIMTYATYSRGYKSAGINLVTNAPGVDVLVKPEQVDDYEVGAKAKLLDDRLTLNGNLFWTNDVDFQANVVALTPAGTFVGYIGNVPEVRTRGLEVDATVVPLPRWNVTVSGTYDDADYVSYPNAVCPYLQSYKPTCNISGSTLAGTPRFALSVWTEYTHSIGPAVGTDWDGFVGGDWHGQSTTFSAVNDDAFSRIGGYQIVGLHAGVRSENGWEVEGWVRNLFDENYYNLLAVATTTGAVVGSYGEPRMFGATIKKTF